MAARSGQILRSYNAILGLRRKDDVPPERVLIDPDGDKPPMDRELFERVVSGCYQRKGWDGDGVPARQTLSELGLGYVADRLQRRGI